MIDKYYIGWLRDDKGRIKERPRKQIAVEHKIGVSFFPSQEVHAAVATAKTSWTKDNEGDEPTSPDASGGTSGGD